MSQSEDSARALSFISYLLNSPQMKGESILSAENMILSFISQNKEQLKHTFGGPQYFPHLSGDEAIKLVIMVLFNNVKDSALGPILSFIDSTDFSFMNKLPDAAEFPPAFHRDSIRNFVQSVFKQKEYRNNSASTYNIFQFSVLEQYIAEIFSRRDFIYNDLVRVQKTYLEADEYVAYLKLLLLIRGTVHLKISMTGNENEKTHTLTDIMKMPNKLPTYISMLHADLRSVMPNISEKSISLAVKSNLADSQTSLDEGSARFLYILSSRYHNYKHMTKVDRGAESPDKSWFAIAKKNAKLFGFEKNMLEELYRIAGDNNW